MDKLAVRKAETYAPDLPWNERDIDKLGPTLMRFMEDHEAFYKRWAETWFNNFQFIYGNQSIKWSRRYGYALNTDYLSKLPALNQRAQTNLTRIVAESLCAAIYGNLPEWDVDTASQSSTKGKRMQRIVQKFLDAMMVQLCMNKELSIAAMILTVYGQVGGEVDWNPTGGRLIEVPQWKKVMAPVFTDYMAPNPYTQGLLEVPIQSLGSQGEPMTEERWEAITDAMGQQVVKKFFAGMSRVAMMTPFEYRRQVGSHGMHKTKYVQRILLLDYDEYLDRHQSTPGRTRKYETVSPVYSNPSIYRLAVRHFMRMQFTTPPGLNEMVGRPEVVYRAGLLRNKVLCVEHYDAPHPVKWPRGRKVVCANGEVTHVTEPSYFINKADGWHPFAESQWMVVAPSSLATGPINDVVQKNRELNVADSLIATALRRNMGSQLLLKTGSGLDPQRFTGEPGIVHQVPDPFAARWLHDDMPLPPVLTGLRQSYKDDVYETSGAGDAIRGERTPGAGSGYQEKVIDDRELRRVSPPKKDFGAFVGTLGEKLWWCTKTNAIELGDDCMGYMMRHAAGEYSPSDVISIMSQPCDFGVEIIVRADSMNLQSKASQQALMVDLVQKIPAAAARLANNPKSLDAMLKFFEAEPLRDGSATHRDRAQRENEVFSDLLRIGPDALQGGRPFVLFEDDDDIHEDEHDEFLLQNAEEMTKNEAVFLFFMQHKERHRIQKQEKLGQVAPGTSLQVPSMMAASRQAPLPTISTIYHQSILKQQQGAAQAPAPGGAPPGAPQAPKTPAPLGGGGGGGQTNPQAPAANTPPAAKQGGPGP